MKEVKFMVKRLVFVMTVFVLLQTVLNAKEAGKSCRIDMRMPISAWKEYISDCPHYVLEETRKTVLNEDCSADETVHYRIKIQKDSARGLGEQKIYYNKSREDILDIQAHVETPDGQKYPYTEIYDLNVFQDAPMYSDLRVKVITLPQVNAGSIIDVKVVSKVRHEIIRNQFSRQEVYPAEPHQEYRSMYAFPKKMHIRFKEHSPSTKVIHKDEGENEVYTFEHKRTMPEMERFRPPFNEMYGVDSFSSMPGWKTIADWYRGLVEKNTIDDAGIAAKVKKVIQGKTTDKEKARAILGFMQDNFRYVSMSFGDNAVEPHPTTEVFQNRYGDCKDWSTLTKQMLNLAGIKANIVIFQDEYAGDPRWSLPSIALFDHVILEVFVDGESYFVDPQLKHFDFGEFPESYDNACLFVIEKNGYRFDTIPAVSPKDALNRIKVDVDLERSGAAVYKVQVLLGQELSAVMRMLWDSLSLSQKDMFFEGMETKPGLCPIGTIFQDSICL